MAQFQIRRKQVACTPTAVAGAQTWSIAIKKGERLHFGSMQRAVAAAGSTTSTFDVRVSAAAGGQPAGVLAATDTEGAVGSIVDGVGADLANAGGFLATADGTIDVTYTPGATPGATVPSARFTFGVSRAFPY